MPAHKFSAFVSESLSGESYQSYTKIPVPPKAETVASPLHSPKQRLLVVSVINDVNSNAGSVKLTCPESKQPLKSIISKLHVPAQRFPILSPVGVSGTSNQVIVYGKVPPTGLISAEPLQSPLHKIFTSESTVCSNESGDSNVIKTVSKHPKLSLTFT